MSDVKSPVITKKTIVLVTGGSGLVGKAIESIINEEHNDKETWIFASSKDGDLRDKAQTEAMFQKYQPTHCIHVSP
jgi:GDP-L-fucose synthase